MHELLVFQPTHCCLRFVCFNTERGSILCFGSYLRELHAVGCEAGALDAHLLPTFAFELKVDGLCRDMPSMLLPGIEQRETSIIEVALRVWGAKQR